MPGSGLSRIALALGATLSLLATPALADPAKVIFAQSIDGFIYGPLYVARAAGYLEQEGIKPEVIISGGGSKAMTAMVAGSVDIYVGAPFELINLVGQGQKALAFTTIMSARPSQIVMRQAVADRLHITSTSPLDERVKSLKGLKLGVNAAKSSGDGLLRYFLKRGGFDPDRDAEIVPVGGAESMVAAFTTGKVDVISNTSPVPELAMAKGPGMLLIDLAHGEIPEYRGYPFICLMAREDWLEKNKPTVSALIRAIAKAETYTHDHKEEVRKMLRPFFPDLDEGLFNASYETNWPGYATEPTVVPKNFEIAFKEYDLGADQPAKVTPDQVANNRYVAAALGK